MPEGQTAEQVGTAVSGFEVWLTWTDRAEGLITTEFSVTTGAAETVMITAELCLITPLRDAFTNSPTVPATALAVKVTGFEVDRLRLPIAGLEMVHAYAGIPGHAEVHEGVARNAPVVSLNVTAPVVGVTATVSSTFVDTVTTATLVLLTVTPSSVAFTTSPTVPEVWAAVNSTRLEVYELRVPIAGFVTFHK
jgi:hypothetical protein